MLRGTIQFRCTNCGNKFWAPDIEWAATIFSVPQRCPQCHSIHTMPSGYINKLLFSHIYENIWKDMEEDTAS